MWVCGWGGVGGQGGGLLQIRHLRQGSLVLPPPEVARRCGTNSSQALEMAQPPVRLDYDMGGGRTPKPQPNAPRDRPWRKSAPAVAAERQEVTVKPRAEHG